MKICPCCGEDTETLYEGYCEICRKQRQDELDLHNATYDWWQGLSDREREVQIRNAGCDIAPPKGPAHD